MKENKIHTVLANEFCAYQSWVNIGGWLYSAALPGTISRSPCSVYRGCLPVPCKWAGVSARIICMPLCSYVCALSFASSARVSPHFAPFLPAFSIRR